MKDKGFKDESSFALVSEAILRELAPTAFLEHSRCCAQGQWLQPPHGRYHFNRLFQVVLKSPFLWLCDGDEECDLLSWTFSNLLLENLGIEPALLTDPVLGLLLPAPLPCHCQWLLLLTH